MIESVSQSEREGQDPVIEKVLGRSFETSSTGMLNERNKMKEKNLKEVLIDRKQKEKMIS